MPRSKRTPPAACLVFLLIAMHASTPVTQGRNSNQNNHPHQTKGADAEADAYSIFSISYVQVHMNVFNHSDTSLFIPDCGLQEACAYLSHIEQRASNSTWKRTASLPAGDVISGSVVAVEPKGGTILVFRFHPNDWKFDDGQPVRYPGKARVIILAWKDKNRVGVRAEAVELTTQEFPIPGPPRSWGH